MTVAVVFFGGKRRGKILEIAKALVRGIEAQGHRADLVDGGHDVNTKLTIYQYIVVGTEAISTIGGKISDKVAGYLSGAGQVSGKRSYAFVIKSFISAPRALARLMQAMEKEGMFIKNSSILNSTVEAEEIGKRLHINV